MHRVSTVRYTTRLKSSIFPPESSQKTWKSNMVERAFCEQYFYVTRMFGTCEGVLSGVGELSGREVQILTFYHHHHHGPPKNPLAPQCQLTQGSSVCGTTWRKLMRSTRLEAINQFRRPKENILLSRLSLQRHTHTHSRSSSVDDRKC